MALNKEWLADQKEFWTIIAHLYYYTMKNIFLTPYYQMRTFIKLLKEDFGGDPSGRSHRYVGAGRTATQKEKK
jgi:hypothetical protein